MFNYFDRNKIEEEFPNAYMIPPMLAWKLPKNKQDMRQEVFNNGEYFAELKIDGSCYTFEYTPDGATYLFSRTVSRGNGLLVEKSDRVPHLIEELKRIFNPGTVVAIEIYKPKGKSKDVTTILGCLPKKAIQRQREGGYLRALVHDLLVINHKSNMETPAIERVSTLLQIFQDIPEPTEYVDLVGYVQDDIDNYLINAWRVGYEGIILKKKDGAYYPGKRPAWSWIKFKQEDDFDVICIGFLPPTKEYTGKEIDNWGYWEGKTPVTKPYYNGWVGSLKMGCYKDGEIIEIGSVASGLTDNLLMQIKENPDKFLNKPMVIKAMETTKDFKLREPKFIKFRNDINIEDCNFNKIFN